jgi:hypothetical protein
MAATTQPLFKLDLTGILASKDFRRLLSWARSPQTSEQN